MDHADVLWRAGAHVINVSERTHVMGIVNVTPDSFSDGGRFLDPDAAVSQAIRLVEDGADILDIGGESTRPGSDPVDPEEEGRRVLPVIERLAEEVSVPISIDTRRAAVARAALERGATIVNDVTAGGDPEMFAVVAEAGAGMCLMHMRGEPKTMQKDTRYGDVVGEVREYLRGRVAAAAGAGIERERLAVDPGLGFGKSPDGNYALMRRIDELLDVGRPILVGPSRKSFIGHVLGTEVDDRLQGTAGAVAWLASRGAHVVRVHDVRAMVHVLRVVDAIRRAPESA